MAYFRHWIETKLIGGGGGSGFQFSEKDADQVIEEHKRSDEVLYQEHPTTTRVEKYVCKFTHEITREDYEAKKIYTVPLNQIIYYPCCINF